jgi:hypothetical protein
MLAAANNIFGPPVVLPRACRFRPRASTYETWRRASEDIKTMKKKILSVVTISICFLSVKAFEQR